MGYQDIGLILLLTMAGLSAGFGVGFIVGDRLTTKHYQRVIKGVMLAHESALRAQEIVHRGEIEEMKAAALDSFNQGAVAAMSKASK